jgi:cytidine deaminase
MSLEIVIIFRHVSAEIIITCRAFYKGKGDLKKVRILSFGMNQMGDSKGKTPGIHAECDAILKLMSLKNKKKLESINLLVIRLSTKNKIQSSKPCSNCIETMKTLPQKKGYKIEHIYYSDEEGNIIKTTLNKLDSEEKHYSKYFRRKSLNIIS